MRFSDCPLIRAALLFLLGWALLQQADAYESGEAAIVHIQQATLHGLAGTRPVDLPHKLRDEDFAPRGSVATYRFQVELEGVGSEPIGIFVPKFARSAEIYLNDQWVAACDPGALLKTRCHHRPFLFEIPPSLWKPGPNKIEFRVHANGMQINGLSEVWISPAASALEWTYVWSRFWRVDLLRGLTWILFSVGALALVGGYVRGAPKTYRWFGISSLVFAMGNVNFLVDTPLVAPEVFAWFTYSARASSVPLVAATVLELFGKSSRWWRRGLVGYALAVPVVIGWSGNDRWTVVATYVPMMLLFVVGYLVIVRWTLKSRQPTHILVSCTGLFVVGTGVWDWLRLRGDTPLESVFLLGYAVGVLGLILGVFVSIQVLRALNLARQSSQAFEKEIARRTADLRQTNAVLEERVEERTASLSRANHQLEQAIKEHAQALAKARDDALQAHQSLLAMEKSALRLTQSISVGTYVLQVNAEGRMKFILTNDRVLSLFRLTREALEADPDSPYRRIHPDDLDSLRRIGRVSQERLEPFTWEGRLLLKDQVRWITIEAVPRALAHGVVEFDGAVVDLTPYKNAENALKAAYERLSAQEVRRSRQDERERLLQDVHDGFGSQLASARLRMEQKSMGQEELTALLEECVADLHLVVDTLGREDATMIDALADFKFRTQRRLPEPGPRVHWSIEVDPDVPASPRETLQILRILQEALNNALRHAKAQNVWVSARTLPDGSQAFRVGDDGVGLPPAVASGRGLNNMRGRARDIGAELSIATRSPQGTDVLVVVPAAGSPA